MKNNINISGDFIKPIDINNDGTKVISLEEWAEKFLNDEDYYKFLEAKSRQDNILEEAKSSGLLKHEPVIELLYSKILQKEIPVTIGNRIIVRDGETLELDQEFMEFEARYSSDPLINYNTVL
jgi:hypothetical protein